MGTGADSYFATGVDESPLILVATGRIGISSYDLFNNDTAVGFLQVFDAAAVADVTLGTTTPDYVFGIPAATPVHGSYAKPLMFTKGIVIGFATTATGNGATSSTCEVSLGLTK